MPDPLDTLYDRHAEREKQALATLEQSFPLDPPNQIKGFLVREARKLEQSLQVARQISEGGVDAKQVQDLRRTLLDQARERFQQYRERVTKRYGEATTLPEVPVSEADHRRFQRVMERLRLVYDADDPSEYHEELRDAIVEAAEAGQRAVVQELRALVDRERKRNRFEAFHEQHPLREAELALDLADQSTDTLKARLAQERLDRLEAELFDEVGRTILEEGTWSGVRARRTLGPSQEDPRLLEPMGPEEKAARTGDLSELDHARRELPDQDPLEALVDLRERLDDGKGDGPSLGPEEAMRQRIRTNEDSYRRAHGLEEAS